MNYDLEVYKARDRRVHDGALCSDMKREFEHTDKLEKRMQEADPTAVCTYFPMEQKFLVFTNSYSKMNPNLEGPPRQLTGNFHSNVQNALIEAIKILEANKTIK